MHALVRRSPKGVSEAADPTLKLVLVDSSDPAVAAAIERELVRLAGAGEVRRVAERAHVVHTALGTAELRDLVSSWLGHGDAVIVAEFERWSGYGPGIDSVWLMRRGH